jgi:hypothetical protein
LVPLGFARIGAALSDAAETFSGWLRPKRGLFNWTKPIATAADGWHAGMVAEWDEKSDLQIRGVNQKYWFRLFNKSDPVLAHRHPGRGDLQRSARARECDDENPSIEGPDPVCANPVPSR